MTKNQEDLEIIMAHKTNEQVIECFHLGQLIRVNNENQCVGKHTRILSLGGVGNGGRETKEKL